jgi:DNA-binding NtrC family response regulator
MPRATILVVDDEAPIRRALAEPLKSHGYEVIEAETGRAALDQLANGIDLVLLDDQLGATEGLSILPKIKAFDPDTLVTLLTASPGIDPALDAATLGAYHVTKQPFNLDEVMRTVERALETTRLRREVRQWRIDAARPYSLQRIVGSSPAAVSLRHLVARVAASPAPAMLLTGESGTGKDLVARIVHYASDRAARPFVNITCAAQAEPLLERTLFGHERGVFADAPARKKGVLETADGGTVVLDDIGGMPPATQIKLLRFLDEKSFKRVGGAADIRVNIRLVAATNRNLEDDVSAKRFRADLFVRLNGLAVSLPPLRSHREDVPLLVESFIEAFNVEFRKQVLGATSAAYALLQAYGWPGNVRELRNVVERAMLLSDGDRLDPRDFSAMSTALAGAEHFELPASGIDLEKLERSLVLQALRRCGGNQTRAGGLLGLNRDQIRYRIEKFGLTPAP